MNEHDLPRHVLDRMERRWASRLARDAVRWQGKQTQEERREVVDRAGRLIPVVSRRSLETRPPHAA